MTTATQIQANIRKLIPLRDAAKGLAKTTLRKEIQSQERTLAILQAMTAREMGNALYQADVNDSGFMSPNRAANVCSYIGRVLIGRNLMMGRTVRLDLENGHHVVCTLEKI